MERTEFARAYHERLFPGHSATFQETDPEFAERFDNFAFDTVANQGGLADRTRFLVILAALLGCQGLEEYRAMLPAAGNFGVTPVEVKEMLYQAVAYLGMGRVSPFLKAANEALEAEGVPLPLAGQAGAAGTSRLEAGIQAQVDIFGPHMRDFWKSGPEESRHINRWLAENCFGDWYTRGGLDYKERELLTLCFLAAQGGCESQLTSHAGANLRLGNGKDVLIAALSQCIPYIGYPRVLNAFKCVNDAAKEGTE